LNCKQLIFLAQGVLRENLEKEYQINLDCQKQTQRETKKKNYIMIPKQVKGLSHQE